MGKVPHTLQIAVDRMIANNDPEGLIAFIQAYADEAVDQDREENMLPANSLLRSAYHVVRRGERGNYETNWKALGDRIDEELKREHVILKPIHGRKALELIEEIS